MRLGKMLELYRKVAEVSQRDVAAAMDVSPASLCRIEQGKACDMRTLGKILQWLLSDEEADR